MSLTALLSKHRNKVVLAAMKPVQHTSRRKFMPFANAVMAAQHAGWSMKLDVSNRFLPYYHPFCVPETASCFYVVVFYCGNFSFLCGTRGSGNFFFSGCCWKQENPEPCRMSNSRELH